MNKTLSRAEKTNVNLNWRAKPTEANNKIYYWFPILFRQKLTMYGFPYLRSENEATFWFHNFLQDKGFDSCTANIFIYHPMLQVGVVHSQADERGFFSNDHWRNYSLWCLGWNQSKSLEASGSTCDHRPAQAIETCWEEYWMQRHNLWLKECLELCDAGDWENILRKTFAVGH